MSVLQFQEHELMKLKFKFSLFGIKYHAPCLIILIYTANNTV